jgi:hypothetical protein
MTGPALWSFCEADFSMFVLWRKAQNLYWYRSTNWYKVQILTLSTIRTTEIGLRIYGHGILWLYSVGGWRRCATSVAHLEALFNACHKSRSPNVSQGSVRLTSQNQHRCTGLFKKKVALHSALVDWRRDGHVVRTVSLINLLSRQSSEMYESRTMSPSPWCSHSCSVLPGVWECIRKLKHNSTRVVY